MVENSGMQHHQVNVYRDSVRFRVLAFAGRHNRWRHNNSEAEQERERDDDVPHPVTFFFLPDRLARRA
jgi:hypothetical protein